MTIDELNALTTLTAADEVPVWDSEESGEPTKKITAQNLAASVKSLASLPNTTEMDNAIQQSTASLAVANVYSGNIDNLLKTGLYYLSGATGTGIGSNGAWGMLIVVTQNGRSVQIHADVWSDYVRFRRYSGSWSTWKDFTLS